MNRNAEMRRLLREAPSTSAEIAAVLDISRRSAQVGIWVLQKQRHARKTGRTIPTGAAGHPTQIYEITAKGRAFD